MNTSEEKEYLRLTRHVNDLKNRINEAEIEKIKLADKIHLLNKIIENIEADYKKTFNDMLNASAKIK